jgi:hypothetical protein
MTRLTAALVLIAGLAVASPVQAQQLQAPNSVVVTIIPGGATFFRDANDGARPSFGNYELGGALALHFNRYVGVEGEVSGKLGLSQTLTTLSDDVTTPNMLNYSGNVIVSAPNRSAVVPYVTAGLGALSLFEKEELGIDGTETFLTTNVGGGVNWYAGRWGLRGDYRFLTVRSKDEAPEFFGRETRYGHRVYGGVLINLSR